MKERKVTTRTCIACGNTGEKCSLVRVVRTPEGHVEIDATNKANGRGAYLCGDPACFENACKRRRVDSALRVRLQEDDYNRLRRDFMALCENTANSAG